MEAENLWRCFLETGAPEYYLLYKAAKAEGIHQLEATNMPKLVPTLLYFNLCLNMPLQQVYLLVLSAKTKQQNRHLR